MITPTTAGNAKFLSITSLLKNALSLLNLSLFGRGRTIPFDMNITDLRSESEYPVLTARDLAKLLNVGSRIDSIAHLASGHDSLWERIFFPTLNRFMEAAQLQPASKTGSHAVLGGLVVQTLEEVEVAMRQRRTVLLPPNADPETVQSQEKLWTYAVFVGALLNNAGKMVTTTRLQLPGCKTHSPIGSSLLSTGVKSYSIDFVETDIDLQARSSVAMLSLLPEEGRSWLGSDPQVWSELTAWLSRRECDWGHIGVLCTNDGTKSAPESSAA